MLVCVLPLKGQFRLIIAGARDCHRPKGWSVCYNLYTTWAWRLNPECWSVCGLCVTTERSIQTNNSRCHELTQTRRLVSVLQPIHHLGLEIEHRMLVCVLPLKGQFRQVPWTNPDQKVGLCVTTYTPPGLGDWTQKVNWSECYHWKVNSDW